MSIWEPSAIESGITYRRTPAPRSARGTPLRRSLVAAYLVTGNPGSGKSALSQELARRGVSAIDPDHDPELSYFENDAGDKVLLVDTPNDPDQQWLESHRWVWSRARMVERLAGSDGPVFVCGIALNLEQFLDLFEQVFLLQIDEATQEARLVAHDTANPPGRNEPGRQAIRNGRPIFEERVLRLGAIALDGTAPTAAIADELLNLITAR
jgi:dephospho-CoA kinase